MDQTPTPNAVHPPLARYRWALVVLLAAFSGWVFHVSGADHFGWPTFWSVGFGIQGAMVVAVVQVFFPLLNVIAFPVLQLALGFLGWYGYAIGAAALAAYLLAQRKSKA